MNGANLISGVNLTITLKIPFLPITTMTTLAKKISEIEQEKENKLKTKACEISIKEGSAYSISEGFGFRYITPFALALGAKNTHIGLLGSVPSLIGSFSSLQGVHLLKEVSRKKLVVSGVFVQALMWLALIATGVLYFIAGVDSDIAPLLVIITYTLLIIAGAVTGPAWNSWMKDIIPEKYGKYFGIRNRICGSVSLIAMLIAGFILDYFKKTNLFIGFIVLFGLAFIGRSASAYLFTKEYEPKFKAENHEHLSFLSFLKKIYKNNFGKFTVFQAAMAFAVGIASPFFAVYMLKDLKFTYLMFTAVTMVSLIVKLLVLPAWGRFTDTYGNVRTMKITGVIIPLVPLFWLLVPILIKINPFFVFPYLLVSETISGLAWAGFDTGTGNFIFDSSNRENMPMFTSYFGILANLGYFAGAVLGGVLSSISFTVFGLSSILFVFLLSVIARLSTSLYMLPKIKEVREVRKFDAPDAKRAIFHLSMRKIVRILR